MLFTATCAIVSCITSIDVDRDYLQDIAIVLQSFFYVLMFLGLLAVVWEATRHWYDSNLFPVHHLTSRNAKLIESLGAPGRSAKSSISIPTP